MANMLAAGHASRNPLDILEEIVSANDWPFDRMSSDELMAEFSGHWCSYHMQFTWAEDLGAMHFSCVMDAAVPKHRRDLANELLVHANPKLWLGHFELTATRGLPVFRHTVLLRGARGASVEQLEDLMDIALVECERFYPAFQFVTWGGKSAAEAVAAALIDTEGEA